MPIVKVFHEVNPPTSVSELALELRSCICTVLQMPSLTPEIMFVQVNYYYPRNFCYIEIDIRKEGSIPLNMLENIMQGFIKILEPALKVPIRIRVLSFDNDHVAAYG